MKTALEVNCMSSVKASLKLLHKHRAWLVPVIVMALVIGAIYVMTNDTIAARFGYRSF